MSNPHGTVVLAHDFDGKEYEVEFRITSPGYKGSREEPSEMPEVEIDTVYYRSQMLPKARWSTIGLDKDMIASLEARASEQAAKDAKAGPDEGLIKRLGGKSVKLKADVSFQDKPGGKDIDWRSGDDAELVQKERTRGGGVQVTLKKGDNQTTLQYDNESEMRKHLQMESGAVIEDTDMAGLNKALRKIMVGVAKQVGANETAGELADTDYEGERFASVVDDPIYNELQGLEREIRTDMGRAQASGHKYDPKHLAAVVSDMGEAAAEQIMTQAMDNLMSFAPREKHGEIARLRDQYWKIPGVKQFEQAVLRETTKMVNKYKKQEEEHMSSSEKDVMKEWRRMALGKGGITEATSEMGGIDIVPPGFTFPDPLAFYGYAINKLPLTIRRSIDRMPQEGQKAMVELIDKLGGLKEATVQLVEIFGGMTDAIDKYDSGSIEGREVARVFRYLMDASRFAQGGAEIAETL